MMSNKQQFLSRFLSNGLNRDFANSDSAKLEVQTASGSLLDGVAVFPDGSVMWVPDSDATGNGAMPCGMALSYTNPLPCQSYLQNRNHCPSTAVTLVKRAIKRQMLSFQRMFAGE